MAQEPEEVDGLNGRMCIVSRERYPAEALIRFVAGPDGAVVPDLKRRLPGRGAHVEARREAVDLAVKRKLFGRALKAEVKASPTLGAEVDDLLRRGVAGSLGLARKAGQLVTGAAKVDAAIRSGKARAVLHASDAAPDGIRKMEAARRAAASSGGAIPAFRVLTSDEMGLALGGDNVIHAAVLAGDAGAALLRRLEALSNYRGERPADETGGCGRRPAQEAEAE
ncbi:RNA-binding protein [Consotaella aegiceratis]|uniref:RNA-binding protein n=1 Tax=Consotaella aegiceratis TaxID=3097961 RepID=UPI002F3E409C